ncbi:MAG: VanZ family protein [Candidatus Bipolaricaulis sp.]
MRLLLDTHTFPWWITDDPRLSGKAREITRRREELVIPQRCQRLGDGPQGQARQVTDGCSTVFHFGGYALLFAGTLSWRGRHRPWLAPAAAVGYGGLLEIFQFLVPARVPSVLDLGVNLAGAVAGGVSLWGAACTIARRRRPGQEAVGSH